MNRETKEIISKLLKNTENHQVEIEDLSLASYENAIKEYSEVSELLQMENPLHALLYKSVSLNPLKDLINPGGGGKSGQNNINNKNSLNNKPKLKYKSQVKVEELDSIINLSLWKNAPTMNLFNAYESKKNVLREEISKKTGQNFNNINKRSQLDDDEEDDVSSGGNTYMINQLYKRKK